MAYKDLPLEIQRHLEGLVKQLPDTGEELLELLATVWQEKETLFRRQCAAVEMGLVEDVELAEGTGLLALTSSGSLLSIGPGRNERDLEYASIKIRTDVPDILLETLAELPAVLKVGSPAIFPAGKISRTSPIHLIARCESEVPLEEQEKRIREATIYLTNGFMKLNRSLHIDPGTVPDQFTMKSMIRYVAKKNAITAAEAKKVLDDFLILVETGLTLGEKVPFGRIGRFSIKRRDAQRARVVKHPSTGKEITVDAKPATVVPKISFSSYIKERLAELPAEDDTLER